MPPLTSRLIRTSRAVRSQRFSSAAGTGSPLGSTNAGAAGWTGEAELAAQLEAASRVWKVLRQVLDAARRNLLGGGAVVEERLAQPRLARDQRLAQEQLAQRAQVVVDGLARETRR